MFYNGKTSIKAGEGYCMKNNEQQLLTIIRESKDPEQLMQVAMEAIIACLQQPGQCESPPPAVLVLSGETSP